MGKVRATIFATAGNEGELDAVEEWLEAHASQLSFVSEPDGCGCCYLSWDVEGPQQVVAAIPRHLRASSDWASSGPDTPDG